MIKLVLDDKVKYLCIENLRSTNYDLTSFYQQATYIFYDSYESKINLRTTHLAYYVDPQLDYNPIETG